MSEARDPGMVTHPKAPRLPRLVGVEVDVPVNGRLFQSGMLHECTPTAEERRAWDRLHRVPAPTR